MTTNHWFAQAVEMGALGYLIKPLSVEAMVPTLLAAIARSRKRSPQSALASNRIIGTAVGILMRVQALDQPAAFERLRRQARSERRKIEDLARSIVEGDPSRRS